MHYRKFSWLSCLIVVVLMGIGCAPKVKTKVLLPAEINLSVYRTVTVIDFEGATGNWGKRIASWLEEELIKVKVDDQPYFNVVSRSRLNKILEEQKLQMTGLTDPGTSQQIGHLLGVNAIITGIVNTANSRDRSYSRKVTRMVKTPDGKRKSVQVQEPCIERKAQVDFSIQFISVETGKIEVSEAFSHQKVERACGERKLARITSPEKLLISCAKKAIGKFVRKVVPHYTTVELKLKKKDDSVSGSGKEITKLLEIGNKFAENGDLDGALERFRTAVNMKPDSPAAHYNLATILELRGELHKAREHYESAARIKPEDDYIKAVAHIQERLTAQEKLKKQLR